MPPELDTSSVSELTCAGWRLAVVNASASANANANGAIPESRPDFHAIATGEMFGNAARGLVAVVTRANGDGRPALEATQIAAQQFSEGVFAAPATLGGGRVAEKAIAAVNDWLFAQAHGRDLSVSLSALLLSNRRVGIAHVGDCAIWRRRDGDTQRLTAVHRRAGPAEHMIPTRAIGAERDVRVDYVDLTAAAGDRFLLTTTQPAGDFPPLLDGPLDMAATRLTAAPGSFILLDVVQLPDVSYDELAAEFSALPLRSPPKDGERVDGFTIIGTLYRSRWTVLKLAEDEESRHQVVLKFPLPAMLHDRMFQSGFLREEWVGRLVRSPWVCKPIDLPPERRSCLYLAMPYYRGEGLARRIVRKPALSVVESIDIVLKLCAGVQSLLDQQIVHRDIKPENVVLSDNGGVTLLDLGMAYLPAIDGPAESGIGGSTHYMAPELFHGATAGDRTEVFALAVTLFRMICGDYPFSGRDAIPPPIFSPHVPHWLERVLIQALAQRPEDRPANPAALATLLEEGLVRGDPLPAHQRRRWHRPTTLQWWRLAALTFAIAFFALLARDLIRGH